MSRLKVITLCSGYDAQCLALQRLGIDFDLWWSEIDKYAIQAHNVLFPNFTHRNLGDMTKIDWGDMKNKPPIDLLTYSTPCQDISVAGKRRGLEEGSGTRSSLLWSVRDCIKYMRPKILLLENVKNMVSKQFKPQLLKWLQELESFGYTNYSQVLDAQDYGVPQHRERIFVVSILDDRQYFKFPEPIRLEKKLYDLLESEVSDKYYLSKKGCNRIISRIDNFAGLEIDVCRTITAKGNDGGCGTFLIDSYKEGKVMITVEIKKILGYTRGCKGENIKYHVKDIANTIHTSTGSGGNTDQFIINKDGERVYSIRKMTERECFRLMGVEDRDIDKLLKSGISRTQLTKLAGNSIVVDVLVAIFNNLFINKPVRTTLF